MNLSACRRLTPEKWFENMRQIPGCDSGTAIRNLDSNFPAARAVLVSEDAITQGAQALLAG